MLGAKNMPCNQNAGMAPLEKKKRRQHISFQQGCTQIAGLLVSHLLLGRRRSGCGDELGTSPTVVIQSPVLQPHKERHHEDVLQESVIRQEQTAILVSCDLDSENIVHQVHKHEKEAHPKECQERCVQCDEKLGSCDWIVGWERVHAVVRCTQSVVITNQIGGWVEHEDGNVPLDYNDGKAGGNLQREGLASHVAVLRQLAPDQNELLQS